MLELELRSFVLLLISALPSFNDSNSLLPIPDDRCFIGSFAVLLSDFRELVAEVLTDFRAAVELEAFPPKLWDTRIISMKEVRAVIHLRREDISLACFRIDKDLWAI